MRRTRLSAGVVILCMLPVCGMAQAMGQVQTDQGAPVPGLPVIIKGTGGSYVALTDEEGRYIVNDLPPGEYRAAPANNPKNQRAFKVERQAPCLFDCEKPSIVIDTLTIPPNWSMY